MLKSGMDTLIMHHRVFLEVKGIFSQSQTGTEPAEVSRP